MAATHPAYNLMKMPGSKSVLTVVGDTKEALMTLKLALKAAATAQPFDSDTSKTKGAAPTKKKQFSLRTRQKPSECQSRRTGPQGQPLP